MTHPTSARPARAELSALIRKNRGLRPGGSSIGGLLRQIAQGAVAAALIAGCSVTHQSPDSGQNTPDTGTPDAGFIVYETGPPPPFDTGPPVFDAGPDAGRDAMAPLETLCSFDGRWRALADVELTRSVDYLALYDANDFGGIPQLVDSFGTACSGANPAGSTCETRHHEESQAFSGDRFLFTDGEDVVSLDTDADRRALLGPINTAHEAVIAVWSSGRTIFCSGEFLSAATRVDGGWDVVAYDSSGGCGSPWIMTRYVYFVSEGDGALTLISENIVREEEDSGCVGRRPAGLRAAADRPSPRASVGGFFADVARLEESAVAAFDRMIEELQSLGAPDVLVREAEAARADEVRHTTMMTGLAERYGARVDGPEIDEVGARSAYEIALENAVEGCVRETYGALLGAHQALAASDPEIAEAMRIVADDEIRHAELSWAVAGWLEPKLSDEERRQIDDAKRAAIVALRLEASRSIDPSLVSVAGLPAPETARALVEQLERQLWA